MTNSTKLTDIPGVRLPYDLSHIHLEVDVEAICKIVRENDIVYTDYTSMKDLNLVGEAIAESIPKWARLVRK